MIKDLLQNKTAQERANIKGQELARQVKNVPRTNVKFSGYDIEIVEIKAIPNGIEVLARAWTSDGKQVGFGKDGSVDLERFIIINPPIKVPDGTTKTIVNPQGLTMEIINFKEDAKEALLQSLAHTIKVKQQKHDASKIVQGKVGRTTTTAYPDAGTGGTTVDGFVLQTHANPGVAWNSIQPAAGNYYDATTTGEGAYGVGIQAATTANQYRDIYRWIGTFDVTAIDDGDEIQSATLSLFGSGAPNTSLGDPGCNIFSAAPAANNDLANGDYDSLGTTVYSTEIESGGWNATGYNNFALNGTGLADISKSVITRFGARESNKDAPNVEPTWASGVGMNLYFFNADQAGTTSDPKLVVEHSTAAGTTSPFPSHKIP